MMNLTLLDLIRLIFYEIKVFKNIDYYRYIDYTKYTVRMKGPLK